MNLLGNYKSVATYKTEGIILKKQKIQEADYIITIFSKHYGKIRAVAKGARRIISRKSGSLELLNWCSFFLAEGRNLDLISEVELKKTFQSLKEDLHKSIYS
ncbi:DNA repair protein RecO, partial [candidate division CPR3 bacterium GWE2_35_7]